VLNRLKTDTDIAIYQATPWAWIVVIADLVDTIHTDHTYSATLRAHIAAHPEYLEGLKYPKPA